MKIDKKIGVLLTKEELRRVTDMSKTAMEKLKIIEVESLVEEKMTDALMYGKDTIFFEIDKKELTVSGKSKQVKANMRRFSSKPSGKFHLDEEDLTGKALAIYERLRSLTFQPETFRDQEKIYLQVRW